MRVLIVSQYFWPETFGINGLVQRLSDRGVELTVLAGKPNYPAGEFMPGYSAWGIVRESYHGADVIRIPIAPRGSGSSLRLAANYLSFIVSGLALGPWLLRRKKFDVVFVYGLSPILQAIPAILLSRLQGAPLVLWVQDLWPESLSATSHVTNTWITNAVRRVITWIYRDCDMILGQSQAFLAPIRAMAGAGPEILYFPNSIDLGSAMPVDEKVRELAADIGSAFSVVFAGNLGHAQDLETILTSAELLKDDYSIRVYLIGSGSREDWLKSEISRRGLSNVIMPGRFPPEAMMTIFSAASALLATLRDEPIFALTIPSKVQAYLSAGRPIVLALNGEGARVIDEAGAGLTCAAGDAKALASAIRMLRATSVEERLELGRRGARYCEENFNPDRLTTTLLDLLERVSKKKQEAAS